MHCLALRKMLLRRSCPSTGHCQSPEWCVALKTTNQWTQVSSLVKCFPFLLPEVMSISLLSLGCPRGLLWSVECDAWSPGPSSPTSILKPNSHLNEILSCPDEDSRHAESQALQDEGPQVGKESTEDCGIPSPQAPAMQTRPQEPTNCPGKTVPSTDELSCLVLPKLIPHRITKW